MHEPAVVIREGASVEDYSILTGIWRSAVLATHDFLSTQHREAIEQCLVSTYLPRVDVVIIEVDGVPVGFAGTADQTLEMLFVHAEHHGAGFGSLLLDHVMRRRGVTAVDVNEQNIGAYGFYIARGFHVVDRSSVDAQGRPYPILHMLHSIARKGR